MRVLERVERGGFFLGCWRVRGWGVDWWLVGMGMGTGMGGGKRGKGRKGPERDDGTRKGNYA